MNLPPLTEEGVARMLREALPFDLTYVQDDFLLQARAVLALVDAEREACAKVCDERARKHNDMAKRLADSWSASKDDQMLYEANRELCAMGEAECLAAAIRARRTK